MSPRAASPEKREAILGAALSVFAQQGFHGASVPEIARTAQVGAGTIYRYFESKEALVNALYRHWKGELARVFLEGLPTGSPFREQFRAIWQGMMRFAIDNPEAMAFIELHHHADYLDEGSRRLENSLGDGITAYIRSAQERQILRDMDAEVLHALVHGCFTGLVRESKAGRFALTPEVIAAAEECVWAAIRR